jgi:hypothetical protein
MVPHIDYLHAGSTPLVQNSRKGGLVAYGVISIVIGAMMGCMAALLPISLLGVRKTAGATTASTARLDARGVIYGLIMFASIAIAFIWVGIGCCRCRRWVRPIILSIAWPWLFMGVGILIVMIAMIPAMQASYRLTPGLSPQMAGVGVAVGIAMLGVIYVLVPGAYLLFFQRADVRTTLDAFDPGPGWTDRCALPVFGMSVFLFLSGVFCLLELNSMSAPFFGAVLTGAPAALFLIAEAALWFTAARLCYRSQRAGWYLTVALMVILNLSWIVTTLFGDARAVMKIVSATYGSARSSSFDYTSHRWLHVTFAVAISAACFAFLAKVRGYFSPRAGAEGTVPGQL